MGGVVNTVDVISDGAQLLGHAARENDARLRVHDDLTTLARAEDLPQRIAELAPEICQVFGLDDGARHQVLALVLVSATRRDSADAARSVALTRVRSGYLADLSRAHASSRLAVARQIEIVDLEYTPLKRRRQDDESRGVTPIVVAVNVAHRVEDFDDRDLFEGQRYLTTDVRMHDEVLVGAFDETHEKILGRHIHNVDIESLDGLCRGRWGHGEGYRELVGNRRIDGRIHGRFD